MGGIFGSTKAPAPPDPYKVADAQSKANIKTAQEQARLAMTGQTSDFGSISYERDPSSPSGYRAVQTLSPEDQALLGQQRDLRANLGDVTNTSLNNVSGAIGQPFDLSAARGREISDIQQTFLDPQWEQQRAALESRLLNQGIRPGSEQYENMMRQFGQQRDDAYNKMFLDAFNVANNAALTERNLPLQDYATLMGTMSPVSQQYPNVNTPAPGVAPTDIGSYIYNSYQAQANQAQNNANGLWGLAGTAATAILSDRRFKRDIEHVGTHHNGLNFYTFRYVSDEPHMRHFGFMADEVAKVHPEAVISIDGVDYVDYALAAR